MKYKNLGISSDVISVIGQGTIGAGGYAEATADTIAKRKDVLAAGIEAGITFLDTGENYENGHAEEILADVIRDRRNKVFVSSKFEPNHHSSHDVVKSLEGSLRRLQTDYVDLYQIHWPNFRVPIDETMRALGELKKSGKIRHIGVCNFSIRQLAKAKEALRGDTISSIQLEYNLYNRFAESELIPYSQENAITIIAYGALNQGHVNAGKNDSLILREMAETYGALPAQLMLAWLVSHSCVAALTQSMSMEHTRDNAKAVDIRLTQDDIKKIDTLCRRDIAYVPVEKIRVASRDIDVTHPIYTTLAQALENKFGIEPSPQDLAQEIVQGNLMYPVELVRIKEQKDWQEYDLIRGRIRYWAWVIAYNGERQIPAYINEE